MGGQPSRLNLRVRLPQGEVVVLVAGALDVSTAQSLLDFTSNQVRGYTTKISIDLAGLSYCDRHGLFALRQIDEYCRRSGRAFQLRPVSAQVQHLLDVAATDIGS